MKENKQVTIIDIAREAGVSVSTVSRVINGSKAVSAPLEKRVCEAIERNNFKPSSIARGLVTKSTKLIGIVLPDISNPVFYNLIKGADSILAPNDYTFISCESQGKAILEKKLLYMLKERNMDGIIFAGVTVDEELLHVMREIGIPIVLVCQEPENMDCGFDIVNVNNTKLGYEATRFLIQNGHDRIAMIAGPQYDISSGRKRFAGYRKALEEAGIPYQESYVRYKNFLFEDGYDGMKQIYEENLQLPTAVLTASDLMAVGAMDFLISNGIEIPEQISVMGTTEIPMSAYYRPNLTTVKFNADTIGKTAANLLVDRLSGKLERSQYYEIDFQIIRRKSVKLKI